ncbi:hypothetical protein GCM10028801_10100 [Nocardioides maradonensis]
MLLLVGGVAWLGWAWRHPHAFRDESGFSEFLNRARVGRTTYVGLAGAEVVSMRVTLTSAAPRVVTNTADATIEVLVCVLRHGQTGGGVGLQGERMTHRMCDLGPASGAELLPGGFPSRELVVAITPHRPGRVRIDGIDVRYDAGWRRGSQHIGIVAGLAAH